MKIAVMQPYFIPYAGYYRLLTHVDCFVVFDCVQFPRRGFVHRNRYPFMDRARWITLPLEKEPIDVSIKDLRFRENASEIVADRLGIMIQQHRLSLTAEEKLLVDHIGRCTGTVTDYLTGLLVAVLEHLGIQPPEIICSSQLDIDPSAKSYERIFAICDRLGADQYINAPGGRDLYCENEFKKRGIKLEFLQPYTGPVWSVLYQALSQDRLTLIRDIKGI
ncbi:MAG: WbqC family protein [Pseudomonadales bacterium]|nr:WbqC family protein [Pseudomonadales bacterium]